MTVCPLTSRLVLSCALLSVFVLFVAVLVDVEHVSSFFSAPTSVAPVDLRQHALLTTPASVILAPSPAAIPAPIPAPISPAPCSVSPPPIWTLPSSAPSLPLRERQVLLALDAHAASLQEVDSRVLLVGLGCDIVGSPSPSALDAVLAMRAALPRADFTLIDAACSVARGTDAATLLAGTWGAAGVDVLAGGPVFQAIILRGEATASEVLAEFVAYSAVLAPGGVILAAGMNSSYVGGGDGNTQGTLAGYLQTTIDRFHCKIDHIGGCERGGFDGPQQRAFMDLVKAVDCAPGVCSAVTYTDSELLHLTDNGAFVRDVLLPQLPALQNTAGGACTPLDKDDEMLWKLGLLSGTDKVWNPHAKGATHQYHDIYTRHVGPRRCCVHNVFEIGLGCDMHYPPGAAFPMWLTFLPNAHVAYMEFDAACVTKFNADDPKNLTGQFGGGRWSLYPGDQTKASDLLSVHAKRGDWDLVIDDGGHSMGMLINTLRTLLTRVVPGGLYILEDVHASYLDWIPKDGPGGVLLRDYLVMLTRELHVPHTVAALAGIDAVKFEGISELAPLIKSIECGPQACVVTRWSDAEARFYRVGALG